MKKLIISAAVAACFALPNAKAQTVNGVRLSEIESSYIEISPIRFTFNKNVFIRLEYGQKVDNNQDVLIKDDNGKDMAFNSALDALNKLKNYGYELFNVYTDQVDEDTSRPVYVMKGK